MQNKITSLLFILLIFALHSCSDKAQESDKKESIINAGLSTKNSTSSRFKSALRSNEKIELGKIYTDTVKYLKFNNDFDDWLFFVEKNKQTIALVYNNEQEIKFIKGEEIAISWKMDSLRLAGDSETLKFTEFLTSPQRINAAGSSATEDQKIYTTIATNGLIVREAPNIHSKRIGKIPFGSLIKLLEETEIKLQIIDNGDTIDGFWAKIQFENFPYKISASDEFEPIETGYVFNKFIEKLNKASIDIREIDSLEFHDLYQSPAPTNLVKITSQKEIEKLLATKVKWKNSENLESPIIDKIMINENQTLHFMPDDLTTLAYYPKEEILLFEGGHGSDFSISLKTGESLETVGNPEYVVTSPSNKYQLNGWFPGQECSNYFFQEKSGDKYVHLTDFGWGSDKYGSSICYFKKFCWLNDGAFIYLYTDQSSGKPEEKYCSGQIKK